MSMACNVDFAKVLLFSSYGWLTLIAILDLSDYRSVHSLLSTGTCRFHLNCRIALRVRIDISRKAYTTAMTSH